MTTCKQLGKTGLLHALKEMGVRPGERLIIHSSLKSIGPIDGGADTLLDALMETVGPAGTIAMPTFSYSIAGYREGLPFHPQNAGSRTGMLTEIFRKREGVCRSLQPTHSVAVWGQGADRYVSGHENTSPLGIDSPFHKLALDHAKILLIGVGFETLSLIHVAEAVAQVPYLNVFCWKHRHWSPYACVEAAGGRIDQVPVPEMPGCSSHFGVLEPAARQAGLVNEAKLGQAPVKIVPALPLLDLAVRMLRETPYFLLCPIGACPVCDERRLNFAGEKLEKKGK